MAEFANKGVAGAGLGLGIAGTALGLLNGNNGLVGGLFGNNCNNVCSDNYAINRYEAQQQARIAELETEVKLRDANTFTMGEMGKLRDYVERRLDYLGKEICDQKVFNATTTSTISCMAQQIAQLQGLTKVVIPIASICPQPAVATTPTT